MTLCVARTTACMANTILGFVRSKDIIDCVINICVLSEEKIQFVLNQSSSVFLRSVVFFGCGEIESESEADESTSATGPVFEVGM